MTTATATTWPIAKRRMRELQLSLGEVGSISEELTDTVVALAEAPGRVKATMADAGALARCILFLEIDLDMLTENLEKIREAQRELLLCTADPGGDDA